MDDRTQKTNFNIRLISLNFLARGALPGLDQAITATKRSFIDRETKNIFHESKNNVVISVFTLYTTEGSVADPWHFGVDPDPCLWLMDQDPYSDPDPVIWSLTFKTPTKTTFKKEFLCMLLFEDRCTSFVKEKKVKRSHKTVEIKVLLTIFA